MRGVPVVVAVVGVGLCVLGGCSDSGAPEADPTPGARTSAGPSSAAPTTPDPTAAPSGFVVTGIDCGLLDQRRDAAEDGATDGFADSDRCVANALATGQPATFRLVTESLEGEAVFALFTVEGPGQLTITEDHRAVLVSEIDERVKTCTGARSLSAQGTCETRDVARGADG
ncbi:hypothetical protein [Nocardioides massiliensis]|uniref:DUF3558 domain-containing protein n=1 Tax=Nocardioides massiliensis TaxID=1325935 RepID=A0ABT9NMG7_9ACTN|nr:hypothetical protein [Nocardioides massiliensis]MDP9821399.1 hypothetical protein [Nocardioides massiliensis]